MKQAGALLRAAAVTIENLFDPETIIVGGLAPDALLRELLRAAEPLPHSIAERKQRTAPRIMLSPHGEAAVLRGAAALAVAGALSPRFGFMFGEAKRSNSDPIMAPLLKQEAAA